MPFGVSYMLRQSLIIVSQSCDEIREEQVHKFNLVCLNGVSTGLVSGGNSGMVWKRSLP